MNGSWFVIQLTMNGAPTYLSAKSDHNSSWYTSNLGRARRYAVRTDAERTIREHGWPAEYDARIVRETLAPERREPLIEEAILAVKDIP